MSGPEPFRVVEDDDFLEEIHREFGNAKNWDDIRALQELDIARFPWKFPQLPGTRLSFAPLNCVPPRILIFEIDGPNATIFYRGVRRTGYDDALAAEASEDEDNSF